jgi:hypothetical protein
MGLNPDEREASESASAQQLHTNLRGQGPRAEAERRAGCRVAPRSAARQTAQAACRPPNKDCRRGFSPGPAPGRDRFSVEIGGGARIFSGGDAGAGRYMLWLETINQRPAAQKRRVRGACGGLPPPGSFDSLCSMFTLERRQKRRRVSVRRAHTLPALRYDE